MDGQTEFFAAVFAAAVLIPFAVNTIRCCHRYIRLCKLLPLSFLSLSLRLHPSLLSLLCWFIMSFFQCPIASRIKKNANDDEKFGLEFLHSLRLPSVFPTSGTWFFSDPPASITGKKLNGQPGSIIFDQKHHMTATILSLPLSLSAFTLSTLSPLPVYHILLQCPCIRFAHQKHQHHCQRQQ
jgi:hypothetical protein